MSIISFFKNYKAPKKLRALFIIHYAPLLLIILIGPVTPIYNIWKIPINFLLSISIGLLIFIIGTFIYFKWSIFWQKTYNGDIVTEGIFKYIRHPHYCSILIVGTGLAFFFYSIFALILSLIAIPIMILSIIDEEKKLLKQYGKDYSQYMKKVPYRLIPKIF